MRGQGLERHGRALLEGRGRIAADHLYAGLSFRNKMIALSGMMLSVLMAALDQTIVVTAMPRVVADLGGFDRFAWVFTAFMLTSTTGIPIMGKLSDLFGRKWVMLAAIAIFLVGSVLAGLSQTMTQLILFRAVQGIGAAGIIANALASLADLFAPSERARWQGVFGSVFAIASVAGPLAGGFITDQWSWRWVFYINVPVGLVAAAVVFFGMPSLRHGTGARRIDFVGAALLIAGVIGLLLALTWGGTKYEWQSPQVVGLFAVFGVALVLFILVERRFPEPIIPLGLFRNPVFTISIITVFLTGFAMFGSMVFIPLFMQAVIGVSATNSGIVVMPMMVGVIVSSTLTSIIIHRTGNYRYTGIAGLLLIVVGMFLLSLMDETANNLEASRNMVLVGLGIGATFPTFFTAVQSSVEMRVVGTATASMQFFRSIGGTLGVAVLGSVMASQVQRSVELALSEGPGALLPSDVRDALSDPQLLIDAAGRVAIEDRLGQPEAIDAFHQGIQALTLGLAGALQDVFLVTTVIAVVGLGFVVFIKQIHIEKKPRRGRAVAG
ncbi:MAG: MDR family MFS transporter [Dehalococcoidia bacterium]